LLKTRNNSGGIVPLGSVATVKEVSGADQITRYNMFTAADLSGQPAPGASSGDALAAVERLAKQILPTSFTTEWTEIALQQKLAGNSAIYIFPLCVLFVFLAALGALRKLVVATRNHFDRPDVSVQFDLRCLAALDGEQHLYADRVHCSGWTRL
jgi:multidrug efflux pump subunit AcrB